MGWRLVVLTDDDVGKLLHYQLEAKFERLFATSPKFECAAMFRARKSEDGVHNFYFSPAAAEILEQHPDVEAVFHASDCPAPFREDVTFVTGDADACFLLHGRTDRT